MRLAKSSMRPNTLPAQAGTEMLADLVTAAVNEAMRAAADDRAKKMESLSGGLNMPGLF